jgi:flagellar protein FliS
MQQSTYLESKVLTATPQRLHLMLVEGALRFARQADEALRRGEPAGASGTSAGGPLLRLIDIVGELLAGVRETKTELNQQLADLYLFLFRKVSEARINSDAGALAEAMTILEYERQTWQLVCEKFGGTADSAAPPALQAHSFDSPGARTTKSGISWQA